ncbi:MAG: ketohexokinase [Pseudomonadota bacterium]|nr:ketohexokinase [Pseudomonadota bacterium]
MARVLAVGVATLDIINEVESYPPEDGEVRALGQKIRRGGNASNTLVVLSQLGHRCEWAGVFIKEPDAETIFSDLERYGIGTQYCRQLVQGKMPTSYVTVSRATASRTIVHYRDLPEYDLEAFSWIPLQDFDWLHFEGRNVPETLSMMRQVREQLPAVPVSLEVEKPRQHIETLFPHADLILFSTAVARHYRYTPEQLLSETRKQAANADIVCTLGDKGAVARSRFDEAIRSDAFPPQRLVDTLAAGDTFNAAMIDALLRGVPLADALRFACQLAGNKCAQAGLHGLDVPARGF